MMKYVMNCGDEVTNVPTNAATKCRADTFVDASANASVIAPHAFIIDGDAFINAVHAY